MCIACTACTAYCAYRRQRVADVSEQIRELEEAMALGLSHAPTSATDLHTHAPSAGLIPAPASSALAAPSTQLPCPSTTLPSVGLGPTVEGPGAAAAGRGDAGAGAEGMESEVESPCKPLTGRGARAVDPGQGPGHTRAVGAAATTQAPAAAAAAAAPQESCCASGSVKSRPSQGAVVAVSSNEGGREEEDDWEVAFAKGSSHPRKPNIKLPAPPSASAAGPTTRPEGSSVRGQRLAGDAPGGVQHKQNGAARAGDPWAGLKRGGLPGAVAQTGATAGNGARPVTGASSAPVAGATGTGGTAAAASVWGPDGSIAPSSHPDERLDPDGAAAGIAAGCAPGRGAEGPAACGARVHAGAGAQGGAGPGPVAHGPQAGAAGAAPVSVPAAGPGRRFVAGLARRTAGGAGGASPVADCGIASAPWGPHSGAQLDPSGAGFEGGGGAAAGGPGLIDCGWVGPPRQEPQLPVCPTDQSQAAQAETGGCVDGRQGGLQLPWAQQQPCGWNPGHQSQQGQGQHSRVQQQQQSYVPQQPLSQPMQQSLLQPVGGGVGVGCVAPHSLPQDQRMFPASQQSLLHPPFVGLPLQQQQQQQLPAHMLPPHVQQQLLQPLPYQYLPLQQQQQQPQAAQHQQPYPPPPQGFPAVNEPQKHMQTGIANCQPPPQGVLQPNQTWPPMPSQQQGSDPDGSMPGWNSSSHFGRPALKPSAPQFLDPRGHFGVPLHPPPPAPFLPPHIPDHYPLHYQQPRTQPHCAGQMLPPSSGTHQAPSYAQAPAQAPAVWHEAPTRPRAAVPVRGSTSGPTPSSIPATGRLPGPGAVLGPAGPAQPPGPVPFFEAWSDEDGDRSKGATERGKGEHGSEGGGVILDERPYWEVTDSEEEEEEELEEGEGGDDGAGGMKEQVEARQRWGTRQCI